METRDPGQQIEHSAGALEEDLGRLEDRIDDAKDRLKDRQAEAQGPGAAGELAGDWEDQAPDRPLGDDADGFDDPEGEDEDEDEGDE